MEKLILGISGDIGSFSEIAGLTYAEKNKLQVKLQYLIDMERVLHALDQKEIDMGIFPIVNIHGGLVKMAIHAMGKYQFNFIDELWLDIQQCLLIHPNSSRQKIKKIISHPQALAQCRQYLKNNFSHAELIAWEDTAKAARDLHEGKLTEDSAVIAPEVAGKHYQLTLLQKGIQDQHPNLTAFIVVKPLALESNHGHD